MLMPKRVKRRRVHRGNMRGKATRGNKLAYGDFGLVAIEPCWIKSNQIEAARIAMTRYTKRTGKVWIKIFPHKPVTKKPAETRMGSGKGNPEFWVAVVKPGRILFEMSGVSEVVAREAFRLASHKLPCKTRFFSKEIERVEEAKQKAIEAEKRKASEEKRKKSSSEVKVEQKTKAEANQKVKESSKVEQNPKESFKKPKIKVAEAKEFSKKPSIKVKEAKEKESLKKPKIEEKNDKEKTKESLKKPLMELKEELKTSKKTVKKENSKVDAKLKNLDMTSESKKEKKQVKKTEVTE